MRKRISSPTFVLELSRIEIDVEAALAAAQRHESSHKGSFIQESFYRNVSAPAEREADFIRDIDIRVDSRQFYLGRKFMFWRFTH